jgi:hypothetical protein
LIRATLTRTMKTTSDTQVFSRGTFLRNLALGLPLLATASLPAEEAVPAGAAPDAGNLRAFVELARSDIRTNKAIIIADNIDFTGDEAAEFWPLHREYELELNQLLDQRLALLTRYASQYRSMTDKEAARLAGDVFDLEAKRTGLKRKYFKKFAQVVAARKAARFFQIENQINLALDLQVAGSLSLIK